MSARENMDVAGFNQGILLPLIVLQDDTSQLDNSTIDHINNNNRMALKPRDSISVVHTHQSQPTPSMTYRCKIRLRRFRFTSERYNMFGTLHWRQFDLVETYIKQVPADLPTGIYIWSLPLDMTNWGKINMRVWSAFVIWNNSVVTNSRLLKDIPSLAFQTKLEKILKLMTTTKSAVKQSKLFDGYFLLKNTPEHGEDIGAVILFEDAEPGSKARLSATPFATYLKTMHEYLPVNRKDEFEAWEEIRADSSLFLGLLEGFVGEINGARALFNTNEFCDDEEYHKLEANCKDCLNLLSTLKSKPNETASELSPNISKFHSQISNLFHQQYFLSNKDFEKLQQLAERLNVQKCDIFKAAFALYLATCKIYNYCIFAKESYLGNLAQNKLRALYKAKFLALLKDDVFSPQYLHKLHIELRKHLASIVEDLKLLLLLKRNLLCQLDEDFEDILNQNEINILRNHKSAEKSVEKLRKEYIEEIETFIEDNENILEIDMFRKKHLELESKLKSSFDENIKVEGHGKRNTAVYLLFLSANIEKYKRKIDKDVFHKKSLRFHKKRRPFHKKSVVPEERKGSTRKLGASE